MEENRTETMHDVDKHHEMACPICFLMNRFARTKRKHRAFFDHLANAQIEMLQAFKSVIDEQISSLEGKKQSEGDTKKASRIEVE
jgi:hypothetical protein